MITRTRSTFLALALAASFAAGVTGCTSDTATEPVTSDEAELNAAMVQDLGVTLTAGSSAEIVYTGTSRFVAVRTIFTDATQGVYPVTVEPLDAAGDAALWITTAGYQNLAMARPAGSRSATVDFEFKRSWDRNMIVVRNESMKPAKFRVSLGAPANPPITDPDEGELVGGAAPEGLVGKRCTGVASAYATHETLDYHGDVAFSRTNTSPETSTVSVDVVSATLLRVTTHGTSGAPRALHAVATQYDPNAISSSPTQLTWDIPVARDAAGTLVGNMRMGQAYANAAIGAKEIMLSFTGKISAPWNGNTLTLSSNVSAKILLTTCVNAP